MCLDPRVTLSTTRVSMHPTTAEFPTVWSIGVPSEGAFGAHYTAGDLLSSRGGRSVCLLYAGAKEHI
ncbi:MAG: hypothetical protein ACJAYU_002944 [Bradymonadia bacterium]|jgi:hypothetical protein